jgi:hypothetical protein
VQTDQFYWLLINFIVAQRMLHRDVVLVAIL